MTRFTGILSAVWREACRHIEIGEAAERIAPLLVRRLPVDLVLIRRLVLASGCVETVGAGLGRSGPLPSETRNPCTPEQLDGLVVWCRQGEITRGRAADLRRRLPGLLPDGLDGQVLAGPLNAEDGPMGLLVLLARPPRGFGAAHVPIARALLEPFTVALENDRRLHGISRLREAAEADRRSLLTRLGRQEIVDTIVGAETGLRSAMERVDLVAHTDAPVLIFGETGSGKEVIARAIHTRSRRASGPFLRANCGAIPTELIDSELFGHERGSFTGAISTRQGWFERADGGALFLDEIGELPLAAQVRLLRILQDGSFERVGGQRQLKVDVRIIGATHRDLHAMVTHGRFREDLWYRLAVFPIHLPPLRDRPEDIPALATHCALKASRRFGTPPLVPTPEDLNLLVNYPWPGNVRELGTVMERAAILGDGRRLEVAKALGAGPVRPSVGASPPDVNAPPSLDKGGAGGGESHEGGDTGPLPGPPAIPPTRTPIDQRVGQQFPTLDTAMSRHIEAALAQTHGRVEGPGGAAALLSINPHTLRARMRKLGIAWRRFRQ